MMQPLRVLFVCLGNICRSPLAEAIFRQKVSERGLDDRFEIDSAGTGGWHIGAPPDARSSAVALERGVKVQGAARQLTGADLDEFDWVIAMDAQNLRDTLALQPGAGGGAGALGGARVRRLREWDSAAGDGDVPDPYYGGPSGFDDVHDIVERSCEALLEDLVARHTGA